MKQDRMTSTERLDTLLNGRTPDRVPFFTFALGFCARNTGYPVQTIYRDPEKSFQAQLLTKKQYGYDSDPFYGYASYGGWEFGGEIEFPEGEYEQAPSHGRFAVETEDDVSRLTLPDVQNAGMLPLAMEFAQIQNKHGISPSVIVGGPFTITGNICPVEILCRWLIKKPELVQRMLQLATDHILDVVRYWINIFGTGCVNAQIWEPLTTNQIISPRQFEKFVLPFQYGLHEKILDMGIKYLLCHICGEQNLNLPYWSTIPMGRSGMISIGSEIDITTAIDYFGNNCVIAGNIEPTTLQTGTSREIYELCRQAIEKGKYAPRGYILMPGCEMPVNTPPHNLYSMAKAIEVFGRYD
jgi:uroporphyrinogen decarboxylase